MKKVLSLVLVLTLVLGSFSFAFAAPNDVVGTEYEDAVVRLGQLKVLEGYPDGTFKPGNEITRAEFAAVVIRAKGLAAAAQAAQGATAFKDVPAGNWAAGYINIASKMGFVKGMGDGTFAPNSPVTYEQAVTMVMRALGYEPAAEARGGYPYGYLIVANETGLLESVKGTQGVPAHRGLVAQIVDNALEIPLMVQVSYGDRVEHIVSGSREGVAEKTLLSELGFVKFTGRVIEANAGKEFIKIEDNKGNIKTLNAGEGFDFQNSYGLRLRVWYDNNGDVRLYTALDTPLFDAVKSNKDADIYLYGEDDYYELATDKDGKVIATLYLNGDKVKIADIDDFDADYAKIVLDSYGDIIWAEGFTFDGNIAVEKLDGNVVESYGYEELSLKGYTVVDKDGKTISIEDLEENDIVFYNKDNKFAVVANMTVEGAIEKVYTDRFVVAGETCDIDGRYLDGKYMNDLTSAVLDSMRKEEKEATVFFDFYGNVVLVVGTRAASTSASNYYLLAAPSREWKDNRNNADYYTLDVLNAEGKIVKYDVKKSEVNDANKTVQFIVNGSATAWNLDTVNTILRLTINTSDKVTKVEVLESHAISADLKTTAGYVGGYKLLDSTVVFRADQEAVKDYDVTTWAKAGDVFTKITAGRYYVGENGRVVAIFADTTDAKAATTVYNARVKDVATKRDGIKEVTFLAGGKEYKLDTETKSIDGIGKLAKYAMVKLTVINKTEKIKTVEDLPYVNAQVTELKPGAKVIVTDLGEFELIDDAVIYKDGTNTTLRFADLKVDDYLNIYKRDGSDRFIIYAVRVAEPEKPIAKGTITYINKDDNDKAITSLVGEVGIDLNVDIVFNNTTTKNIPIAKEAAVWQVVNNATGLQVATGNGKLPASADVVVLAGKSVNLGNAKVLTANLPVGEYTLVLTITSGSVTYNEELPITIKAVKADADAAQVVINDIKALGATPTKAAVEAADTKYQALSANGKALVTNYTTLKAFTDDIAAGTNLQGQIAGAGTVGAIKQLRTDYNKLGNLGRAEVTLADIEAKETALANAKTALANKISAAETLYNAQKDRVDSFSAAEINTIDNGTTPGAFTTYNAAVAQLKADITTAKGVDVNADATTLVAITGAKTTLDTAVDTTFAAAKTAFDTNTDVVATGK